MAAQLVMVAIQLLSIVILSRLLDPEDFGVIAMITAITAFMGLFRDMGLSTASIQKGDLSHAQTSALFWLNALAGFLLMLLVMALSPAIAWFYHNPALVPLTAALSTTFLFSSLGAQHSALMQRELRFKPKAIADVSGAAITLIISVTLAMNEWRYWALAAGTIVGAITTTILYCSFSRFKPAPPRIASGLKELIGFGANVTAFEIVNYLHRNLDNILIGRFWGAAALGMYSRGYQMMMLPIVSLRTPINSIAFPVLSRLRNDHAEFRRYYRRISSLLALLSMPLMTFLVLNASDVIEVALGNQWAAVAPIFVFLGLAGFIQPVASLRGLILLSLGKSRRYLAWGVMNTAAVSAAFLIGIKWGGVGVAASYAAVNYIILYPSLVFIFRDTPLSARDFFEPILMPAATSVFAGFGTSLAVNTIGIDHPTVSIIFAAITFALLFLLGYLSTPAGRKSARSYITLIKNLKN